MISGFVCVLLDEKCVSSSVNTSVINSSRRRGDDLDMVMASSLHYCPSSQARTALLGNFKIMNTQSLTIAARWYDDLMGLSELPFL